MFLTMSISIQRFCYNSSTCVLWFLCTKRVNDLSHTREIILEASRTRNTQPCTCRCIFSKELLEKFVDDEWKGAEDVFLTMSIFIQLSNPVLVLRHRRWCYPWPTKIAASFGGFKVENRAEGTVTTFVSNRPIGNQPSIPTLNASSLRTQMSRNRCV